MSGSEQWAREKLEQANRIYEPDQLGWPAQAACLLVWGVELVLIWWLAGLVQG